MTRKSGTRIRKKSHHQTLGPARPASDAGRYLSLHDRLHIADLERLGCRFARSPWNSVDTLPPSSVSWTATVTSTGGICHTAPMTPHGFAAAAHANTNWWPVPGYGHWSSAS